MKLLTKCFLIGCALFAYLQVQAQPQNEFQLPTFIGADAQSRQALQQQLSSQTERSDAQQRQLLLVTLALLANSKDKTLDQLKTLADQIQNYLKTHKDDAEMMAAAGSAVSLQSLFFQHNVGKMNYLSRKGMRLMDRAVKKFPNNLGARLLRGLSYANMPAFLGRAGFAKTDLELVKAHIPEDYDKSFAAFVDEYLAMATAKLKGDDQ